MFYQRDLDFLSKTFTKCGISFRVMPVKDFGEAVDITPRAFYRLTDVLGLHYIFFLLPGTPEETLLLIGPYEATEMAAENGSLMVSLDIFCETIWGDKSSYEEVIIDGELKSSFSTLPFGKDDTDEYVFSYNMRQMEARYAYENEILDAVASGHSHRAELFFPKTKKNILDNRFKDTLRNTKNYLIIMNTLCRKAAEKGGVHPLYLNRLSSQYAQEIESHTHIDDVTAFMRNIFKDYCKMVKNHNTKNYSILVQDAILYIESNLESDLSLHTLAKYNNVTPSYLSTLFKRETGITLTSFVTEKRISLAKHLLHTTNMQVQNVAQECGILDVQYFSKVFKKYTGKSPKEYRESL